MYRKTKLKNGLRIITVPQKGTKAATVLVLVKAGSKYENKDISGISHFLEHMLFKGTEKRKGPMEVAEDLDNIGGEFNAFTGEEYTGYYAKVNYSNFDIALDWVSDIFLNSKIPSKELLKEKGVIFEEINMYRENPMMYIGDLWKQSFMAINQLDGTLLEQDKAFRQFREKTLRNIWMITMLQQIQ